MSGKAIGAGQAIDDAAEAPEDPTTLGQSWWKRYSPHGEFAWSWMISLGLHLFLAVLIIVVATPFFRPDPMPPAVDSVALIEGDDGLAGEGGPGDGLPGDVAGTQPKAAQEQPPEPTPVEVAKVEKPDPKPLPPEIALPDANALPGEERIEEARARINAARSALADRFTGPAKPGGTGKGGTGGTGSGTGGDGSGTGRGGRVARWVLKFRTRSSEDYLEQLEGLGATLALPLAGERGDRWRFFDHPASAKDRWADRDLSGENRIHWVDENAQNARLVAQILAVPSAPFLVAFLPVELESRMLELELSYQNRREDEIRSTTFEVARRGGKDDIMVLKQVLK
jgi:hypothetical protein